MKSYMKYLKPFNEHNNWDNYKGIYNSLKKLNQEYLDNWMILKSITQETREIINNIIESNNEGEIKKALDFLPKSFPYNQFLYQRLYVLEHPNDYKEDDLDLSEKEINFEDFKNELIEIISRYKDQKEIVDNIIEESNHYLKSLTDINDLDILRRFYNVINYLPGTSIFYTHINKIQTK